LIGADTGCALYICLNSCGMTRADRGAGGRGAGGANRGMTGDTGFDEAAELLSLLPVLSLTPAQLRNLSLVIVLLSLFHGRKCNQSDSLQSLEPPEGRTINMSEKKNDARYHFRQKQMDNPLIELS
jgi:hypothetical protein